jgi:hypothetical protein
MFSSCPTRKVPLQGQHVVFRRHSVALHCPRTLQPRTHPFQIARKYHNAVKSANSPHIYAIADQAYHNMKKSGKNQCAVVRCVSTFVHTENAERLLANERDTHPATATRVRIATTSAAALLWLSLPGLSLSLSLARSLAPLCTHLYTRARKVVSLAQGKPSLPST